MRALIACLLCLVAALSYGQSFPTGNNSDLFQTLSNEPEFLPVEEAYKLAIELEANGNIRLYWQIADTYYLYQHRFTFTLTDANGAIGADATLPPALARTDEYFGEVHVYYRDADVTLTPSRASEQMYLQVKSQGCADAGLCYPPRTQNFMLDFDSGTTTETVQTLTPAASPAKAAPPTSIATLLYMLALAFAGGIILNLMPCVFPILSLKVLSFARSEDHDRHIHGWFYAVGVVSSFVAVAAVLIGLQQAGSAIGWGFQLQTPGFVIALAYLFVAMGLSLSGVIQFGGRLMNLGGGLAEQPGGAGSFFTGVLAVVVASPCTAPFMGTALGFAATQPAAVGLLVFAALGAGMAAPLLLLSYSTLARRLMPKPGPWMETLKELLAFPLYATALWLLWVAGRQTDINTMTVALAGALMLALGLWLWGEGTVRKGVAVLCIATAISLATWRGAGSEDDRRLATGTVAWSVKALAQSRAVGNPVFVDVTADWCLTCIANEQAVLFTDEMTARFAAANIVYMVADWTNYDPEIAAFIAEHGRSGIPLYLMYPAQSDLPPIILPQILSDNVVIAAIETVVAKNRGIARNF
jgi:thiol:disulfide interchange protein